MSALTQLLPFADIAVDLAAPAVKNIRRVAPLAQAAKQKYQDGRFIGDLVGEPTLAVFYKALKRDLRLNTSGARVTPIVERAGQVLDTRIDTAVEKVALAKDAAKATVKTPLNVLDFFNIFLLG